MDFNRLKELANKLGGILILNGNEPEFIILPYKKYEKIETGGEEIPISSRNGFDGTEEQSMVDVLNKEILALKEEIRQKEEAELVENEQSTEPVAEAVDFD